jgi:hypothetical protein
MSDETQPVTDKPLTLEEQKSQMSDLAWTNLANVFASGNPPEPEQPEHIDGGTFEIKGEGLSDAEIEELRQKEKVQKAWNALVNHPIVQAMREEQERANIHIHGPFTFLMNTNHNALRGCTSCGQAWVGVMAGTEDSIRWHVVMEVPEEEE